MIYNIAGSVSVWTVKRIKPKFMEGNECTDHFVIIYTIAGIIQSLYHVLDNEGKITTTVYSTCNYVMHLERQFFGREKIMTRQPRGITHRQL